MKFKISFRKKAVDDKKEYILNDTSNLNGPTINFGSTHGKWLEILKYPANNITFDEVKDTFRLLLLQMGIDNSEACTITENKDESYYDDIPCFTLHFEKSNKDMTLQYAYDSDGALQFRIKDGDTYRDYLCKSVYKKPLKFELRKYTISNSVYYRRYYSNTKAEFILKIGNHTLSMEITKQEHFKEGVIIPEESLIFANEDKLREYLLSLTFPIDIIEVYKRITEISLGNIKEYHEFEIKTNENGETTNLISLVDGAINSPIIVTKDKRKITLNNEACTYSSQTLNLDNANCYPSFKLDSNGLPIIPENLTEQIKDAQSEIEAVKTAIKSLFEKKAN